MTVTVSGYYNRDSKTTVRPINGKISLRAYRAALARVSEPVNGHLRIADGSAEIVVRGGNGGTLHSVVA